MSGFLKTLVQDYRWVHTSIGLVGNFAFVVGSVLFLPAFAPWATVGVWLFIVGSALMMIASAGNLLLDLWEEQSPGK